MDNKKSNKTRWLHIRLSEDDLNRIRAGFSSSTKKKISDYARDILLNKPVTVYTRDKSFDEIIEVLNGLKKELSAIGNNFNQVVHKLHTIDSYSDLKIWSSKATEYYAVFTAKTIEINLQVKQILGRWLQE